MTQKQGLIELIFLIFFDRKARHIYCTGFKVIINFKGMRSLIFLLIGFSLFTHELSAQKVFSTDYAHQADLKVFVVDYAHQADLSIFLVDYAHQAEGNEGLWFFTQYAHQADKRVFFVDYAHQADLKIFIVDYPHQAKWQSASKKHLMFR